MFGNCNNEKIKELNERIENQNERIGDLSSRIRKLEFLISHPAKYTKGDKLFKRFTICEVDLEWVSQCHYGYWEWKYRAFDSELNIVVTMVLDCCGKIINQNKICKA